MVSLAWKFPWCLLLRPFLLCNGDTQAARCSQLSPAQLCCTSCHPGACGKSQRWPIATYVKVKISVCGQTASKGKAPPPFFLPFSPRFFSLHAFRYSSTRSWFQCWCRLKTVYIWSHSHSPVLCFFSCDPTTVCGLVLETELLTWYNGCTGGDGGRKRAETC